MADIISFDKEIGTHKIIKLVRHTKDTYSTNNVSIIREKIYNALKRNVFEHFGLVLFITHDYDLKIKLLMSVAGTR